MTTASVHSARFPDLVWETAVLRGLDARARGEIEAAGRLLTLRAGEHVYRGGDPADALFVVVEGEVALVAVRRGDAEADVIRTASRGEIFGEEATVIAFGVRQIEARCEEKSVVAEVPLTVLRRAIGRAGAGEHAARLERALRRAATLDLFRTASFTRALPERDVEIFLDAAEHVHVARGEHLYREGDDATHAYLVADGLLQAQSDDEGAPRVEAYLARGDVFGDDELEDRSRRRVGVVASGPAWLVALPRDVFLTVARRQRAALDRVRRVRVDALPAVVPGGAQTTAHVFQDLYRLRVARSLLVIDQDACVRCGHCAWSCASTHDDGISRLVRRGDKIVVQREEASSAILEGRLAPEVAPLLVPNSCQHCKNPSCMIDCPTGAIGRDARGEVFIREDLCTGCGSCAKACPWDNIQIAPRAAPRRGEEKSAGSAFPEVAVKCDLCSGGKRASAPAPACVAACPTQAIARIDPNAALVELRAAPAVGGARGAIAASAVLPRRAEAWPWAAGAVLGAVGLAAAPLSRWPSGVVAGALMAVLVGYSGLKRSPRLLARVRPSGALARALYVAHLAVGALTVGAVLAHGRGKVPGDLGGALTLAVAVALATGAFGALAHATLPRRLSRLERKSVLPEELAARQRELGESLFSRLSGKSEVVKTLYGRVLRPYWRARFGGLLLIASGRSLREEERRVRGRLDALLEGRRSDRLEGMAELVRLVVEHRATVAARVLTFVLRGWLGVHVAATAAAIVLVVLHVIAVVGKR